MSNSFMNLFIKKPSEPVVVHQSCSYVGCDSTWYLELAKARIASNAIPSYANQITEDGFTMQEVFVANHLIAYGNSIGVFMTTPQVAGILVSCTSDTQIVNELSAISEQFKKASELL